MAIRKDPIRQQNTGSAFGWTSGKKRTMRMKGTHDHCDNDRPHIFPVDCWQQDVLEFGQQKEEG